MKKYLYLRYFAFVVVITCVIYSNHFHNAFHFDDWHTVESNTYIRDLKNIPLFFKDATSFSTLPANQSYRPIVSTSLAIDYWLGNGYDLFYFHLSTFIFFLLQGLLMLLFFVKVFNISYKSDWNPYLAIGAVGWYLLHPAIAETVNYVIARSDIQSTFFVMLAFVLYTYSPFCKRTLLYLIPVGIGALAKPPAVMFAPILFFYITLFEQKISLSDFFRKDYFKQVGKSLIQVMPAFVFCGFMYWWVDKFTPHTWQAGGSSSWLYLITQPFVVVYYFATLFFPIHLSADTDWQLLSSIWDIRFFAGCVFIGLMLGVAVYASRKEITRPISFGILWFFLALIPTSSIVPLAEVMNDHRMFFPFVGLIMSVVWVIGLCFVKYYSFYEKYSTFILSAIGIILVCYAVGTYQRNKVWKTDEGLWYDVTLKSPKNSRGLMNYGLAKMSKGEYGIAEDYYTRALALSPNYFTLQINMGVLKEAQGDKVTAEKYFKDALQNNQIAADSWFFYGKFLFNQSRYAEAIPLLSKAIEISPGYLPPRELLMKIYDYQEDFDKLKSLAENTLQIVPTNIEAQHYQTSALKRKSRLVLEEEEIRKNPSPEKYLNLSLAYYQLSKYQKSIEIAKEAIKIKPDFAEAYNNIGSAYNVLKQYEQAKEFLKKAIEIKPDFQLAKNNLAVAENTVNEVAQLEKLAQEKPSPENYISLSLVYFNQNKFEKCIEACRKALVLKPDYDLAYNNICASYNQLKEWDKAIVEGEKGLKINPTNVLLKNNLAESYKNSRK